MNMKNYFKHPKTLPQRQYEALRSHFIDNETLSSVAVRFGLSESYLRKELTSLEKLYKMKMDPFFAERKKGPRIAHKSDDSKQLVINLRKQNLSIVDIKAALEASGKTLSFDTINRILTDEGFKRLPRRTYDEKQQLSLPNKFTPPRSSEVDFKNEEFSTGQSAGILLFLPLLHDLGIISAIQKAGFPSTEKTSSLSYVLSFLALKLMGNKRLSHDESWSLDRVLGLFAGLNVLPKNSSLASYSYRISRESNKKFLLELSQIFNDEEGEFNVDFKTIPHWGDSAVLEKNYAPTRGKSVKSVLALIVQGVSQQYINYTDAEVKKSNQNDAILEFVDFWKEGHDNKSPKMLIFDSKVTTQGNLNKLNEDGIKFITLRQRGPQMQKYASSISEEKWQHIDVNSAKKKTRTVKVFEEKISTREYKGQLRQIIIVDHSKEPVFMITNDFEMKIGDVIRKYGRRWLVEQEISEQIIFFHLNSLSSTVVVKVDFDLTMTVLAHNLYRKLSASLPGFGQCTVDSIHRMFIDGRASVKIRDRNLVVNLNRRAHLPLLYELPWFNKKSELPWMKSTIEYKIGTSS